MKMLQFDQYTTILEDREIKHRSTSEGKPVDEEVFSHFGNVASRLLRKKISPENLFGIIEAAKNDPDSPLSFKNAPKSLFFKGQKTSASKKAYFDMLYMSAHSLGAFLKHKDAKDYIQNGFTIERVGRGIFPVSGDWLRQGVVQGSVTGTPKSDVFIKDEKTGKKLRVSMKRGAGQGFSAQPSEAMSVLTYTANETMKKMLGDRASNPGEYAQVFATLAAMNKLLRSSGNIQDKSKRDARIQKIKPLVKKMFDELYDRPYLGREWKRAIIGEGIRGEGKFGKRSDAVASHVLSFGGRNEASFYSTDEYLNLSDEEIDATPIYWTLPKTEGGKYTVFRSGTPKRIKKEPTQEPEQKQETRPARQEPQHPFSGAGAPGSPDTAFYAPHELTRPRVVSRSKPAKTGVISKMKAKVKGAIKKVVRQPAPTKSTRPQTPWDKIQPEYTQGRLTVDDISRKYNINPATIKWHAGTHGWKRGVNI